jgi:hypothetical protein
VRAAYSLPGLSLRSGGGVRHAEAGADGFAIFDWGRGSAVEAGNVLLRGARDFEP